jgi:hypothetical protein
MITEKDKQMARDNTCFKKAQDRDQRTFTLVEQDKSAPLTILAWIVFNWDTSPEAKLMDAFEDALAMKRSAINKKNPD